MFVEVTPSQTIMFTSCNVVIHGDACWQVTQSELDLDTVRTILSEYKIHNADISLRYDASTEDLIDVIEGNRVYVPCIYLLNKIDQISIEVCVDTFCSKTPEADMLSVSTNYTADTDPVIMCGLSVQTTQLTQTL